MGNQKEKVEPKMIQAQELFCNQPCPKCKGYLSISHMGIDEDTYKVTLGLFCLSCDYKGTRELI